MELVRITKDDLVKSNSEVMNLEQLQLLIGATPKQFVKKRPAKGGGTWDYVSTGYVQKILNITFGWNWDFQVIDWKYIPDVSQVIVHAKLTVRCGQNVIIKEQFGRKDVKMMKDKSAVLDLGNDIKGATSDALKKCASLLGIASDIYNNSEFRAVEIIDRLPDIEVDKAIDALKNGTTMEQLKKKFSITKEQEEEINGKI